MRRSYVLALALLSCAKPAPQTNTPEPSAEPVTSTVEKAASRSGPLDLSPHGLPLTIAVPSCVKVAAPMVKVAENAKDVMLACPISDSEAMAGKAAFAIQLGLAKGKVSKAEIAKDPNFVRFLPSPDPKLLRWETNTFNVKAREFMLRFTKASVDYLCFTQRAVSDDTLLSEMERACLSAK